MRLSDFNYELPEELIAQDPLEKRDNSRLMVLHRATGELEHKHFYDVIDYLNPGDCLVINDTKVIPARLMGAKEGTGASIEVLLLKRREERVWETLVKPGKKARAGTRICFGDGLLTGEVIDVVEEGNRLIRFEYEGIFEEILDRRLILRISFGTGTVIRLYMPDRRDLQQHRQQACILRRICCRESGRKASGLPR